MVKKTKLEEYMMSRFENKVVVITGAAGLIGKTMVKKVHDEGGKVTLVDMNEEALTKTVDELALTKDNYLIVPADVTNEEQVKNYVDKTVERFGKIDGFFNNAGVEGTTANVEDYPLDTFDFVLNVNVKGAFLGLKYVVPVMKKQGYGSIVNTASGAGLSGAPGMIGYNTSKHAVIGMTRVVASEVASENIRVNAVAPGVINSKMMRRIEDNTAPGQGESAQKAFNEAVPMGRYGEPKEVANVVAFLLSDEAAYVSQSIYTVDGGQMPQ